MSKYVLDAYAWIEYLNASKKGSKVKELFEKENNSFFTHKVTFSEVISVFRRRDFDPEIASGAMVSLSQIYEGNLLFYKEVGLLHADLRRKIKDFGLADAFVLLTARKLGAKVITGDSHFKGFKEVVFLG
ncbi:MAG TPA: PIN domain-containing protein [Candidatus Nanoarchaeia archaeon]|nr:PIN domain-containing protein [Candidatus Nanoarchaeia archaeon]